MVEISIGEQEQNSFSNLKITKKRAAGTKILHRTRLTSLKFAQNHHFSGIRPYSNLDYGGGSRFFIEKGGIIPPLRIK